MAEPHTTDNLSHVDAPVAISDGHAPVNGGTLPGSSPLPAADFPLGSRTSTNSLTELAAAVTDGGTPAEGGSPKGGDLVPAADSDPDECFSEARYHRLHNTAVSFVSSDIRVFNFEGGTPEVALPSPPITTRVTRALPSDDGA